MKKCKAALAAYAAIALVLGGGCLTSCRHSSGSDGGEEPIVNPNEADFSAKSQSVETDSLGGAADSASSSDESIATVAVADGVVTVTSVAAGTATITVAKSGYSNATFTVTVAADGSITVSVTEQFAEISANAVLTGISASSSKTSFTVGDDIPTWADLLTVTATYDGTTQSVVTDFSAITVTGWNSSEAGEITLTVTYGGKSTTFKVTIAEKEVEVFPSQNQTVSSESLGAAAESASSSDPAVATVAVAEGVVTVTSVGEGTATITVAKSGYSNATFTVTVAADGSITVSDTVQFAEISKDAVLTGISASPSKASFFVGDAEPTWSEILSVNAIYDGTTETAVTDFSAITVAGWNSTAAGEITLTVTYEGKTSEVKVSIVEPSVESIAVTAATDSIEVAFNTSEDDLKALLTVTATYDNGKEVTVTDYTISGYTATKSGEQTVKVTALEKTATIKVTVQAQEAVIDNSGATYSVADGVLSLTSGSFGYYLSKENLTDTTGDNAWTKASTDNWQDNVYGVWGTDEYTAPITAYNMSKTDRYITLGVSGVYSVDLYVKTNTSERSFTVTVGTGTVKTFSGKAGAIEKYSFETGTLDATSIKIAGKDGSLYPYVVVLHAATGEQVSTGYTVDVPTAESDITLTTEGNTVTVTEVTGASYAWYVDNVLQSGASAASFTLPETCVLGQTYEVRALVTVGSATYAKSVYVMYQ